MRFLVDTNVPLTNPDFSEHYDSEDEFVICRTVLNELDGIKGFSDATGKNARTFLRMLDTQSNPQFTIVLNQDTQTLADDNILAVLNRDKNITLLSNDANMRIKARAMGFKTLSYEFTPVDYCGITQVELDAEAYGDLVAHGEGPVPEDADPAPWEGHWVVNTETEDGVPAVFNPIVNKLVLLKDWRRPVLGILPKNLEQQFLMYYLCNPEIKLLTVKGKAGSGKTLLALAAGLHQVMDGDYSKMVVSRPVTPLEGQDIGFLPGSEQDKLRPWLQPIFDNLEILSSTEGSGKKVRPKMISGEELIEEGVLEITSLSTIRGRSMPNQFFIIDEAQNLNFHALKTILTRAGNNTKVILTGDIEQSDLPKGVSGMNRVISAFKDSKLAAHITLEKTERSALAEEAATKL